MKRLTITALLVATAGIVQAETYDSSGVVTGQSASTMMPLSDGHMVLFLPSSHDNFDMVAEAHPFEDMAGNCNGSVEVLGLMARGSGHCVYTNSADETLVVSWIAQNLDADGAFHGKWTIVDGSGAMSSATGGGNFASLTDSSSGIQTTTLTGAMTLP